MSGINWSDGRGTLTVAGKSLEWAVFGERRQDEPVIVMLHEGLGCLELWRDVPGHIAEATGFAVFAYSRAGYGQSDAADLPRPLDYMTREATEGLPRVLDAIGAQQVILLGHSDGATIAAEYAGRVEDFRVRGLILMAPHFFTEPMGLAEIAQARDAFASGGLRDRLARYHRDPDATFYGWNDAWLAEEFRDWNVGEVIDYIRVPALVLQGEQDPYGTMAQVREIESRSYAPVETVSLPDCRHAPHLEQPQATLAAIAGFTRRLARIEQEHVEIA